MAGWKEFLVELGRKLAPILAFVVLVILLVAWFGKGIPTVFQALIYIVVIGGMLIYAWQVARRMEDGGSLQQTDKMEIQSQDESQKTATPSGGQPVREVQLAAPVPAVSPEKARERYLEAILADCRPMRLSGLDEQAADPSRGGLTLESLYVSLDTTTQVEEKKKGKARDSSSTTETVLERERSRPLAALEALAQALEFVLKKQRQAPSAGKEQTLQGGLQPRDIGPTSPFG